MRDFESRINADAPVRRAWQVLAELERWPEWTPTVRSVERLDEGPVGVGTQVRIEQPRLRPAVWTVTRWEPERAFAWESRSPGVVVTATHAVEARDEGCKITLRLRFDGLLGGFIGRFSRRMTSEYLSLEAASLKLRAEKED
jgi:uncharacterized membrane protein